MRVTARPGSDGDAIIVKLSERTLEYKNSTNSILTIVNISPFCKQNPAGKPHEIDIYPCWAFFSFISMGVYLWSPCRGGVFDR